MKGRKIFILMGGSGTGKTTLGEYLKELGIAEMISHTTRAMRVNEVDGITYYYVSREEFDRIDKIEWTEYPKKSGLMYCLSRNEVEGKLSHYGSVFAITDSFGMKQVQEKYPNEVEVIYLTISLKEMERRMRSRGDSEEIIQSRLLQAKETKELENHAYADHIIENINLEDSKRQLKEIVEKETLREKMPA
jgi:guanylate kinase